MPYDEPAYISAAPSNISVQPLSPNSGLIPERIEMIDKELALLSEKLHGLENSMHLVLLEPSIVSAPGSSKDSEKLPPASPMVQRLDEVLHHVRAIYHHIDEISVRLQV